MEISILIPHLQKIIILIIITVEINILVGKSLPSPHLKLSTIKLMVSLKVGLIPKLLGLTFPMIYYDIMTKWALEKYPLKENVLAHTCMLDVRLRL